MGFKVAYHMEGWEPEQLLAFQIHHNRSGGDLEHCDTEKKFENDVIHGSDTWAEEFIAEVEFASQMNMRHAAVSQAKAGRPGEAKKVRAAGPQKPWKKSGTLGPVRSVVLTADYEFFKQQGWEDFEGADFRDPAVVEEFKQRAIAYMDSEVPREHCLYMVFETDEKTPHLHAYYAAWNVKETKGKGLQRMLQPTDMIHFRNAEKAQTSVAEWFAPMGLERGDEIAKKRREAKAAGEVPPAKKRHTPPWLYRRQQRAEFLSASEKARADIARSKGRERAARDAEADAKKAAEAEAAEKKKSDEARQKLEAERIENERVLAEIRAEEKIREADRKKLEARSAELEDRASELDERETALKKLAREIGAFRDKLMGYAAGIMAAARRVGILRDPVVEAGLKDIAEVERMQRPRGFEIDD